VVGQNLGGGLLGSNLLSRNVSSGRKATLFVKITLRKITRGRKKPLKTHPKCLFEHYVANYARPLKTFLLTIPLIIINQLDNVLRSNSS
jgi:hypothetical protein